MNRILLRCAVTEGHFQLVNSFIDTLTGYQLVIGAGNGHCQLFVAFLKTADGLCLRHRIRKFGIFRQHLNSASYCLPGSGDSKGCTANLSAGQLEDTVIVIGHFCDNNGLAAFLGVLHLINHYCDLLIGNQRRKTDIQSRGLTLPDDEVAAGHHDPRLISGSIDALGIIEPEINIIGGLIAALCYGFLQHLKDDILANVFDLQVLRVDGHRLAGIGELHIDRFAISQIAPCGSYFFNRIMTKLQLSALRHAGAVGLHGIYQIPCSVIHSTFRGDDILCGIYLKGCSSCQETHLPDWLQPIHGKQSLIHFGANQQVAGLLEDDPGFLRHIRLLDIQCQIDFAVIGVALVDSERKRFCLDIAFRTLNLVQKVITIDQIIR